MSNYRSGPEEVLEGDWCRIYVVANAVVEVLERGTIDRLCRTGVPVKTWNNESRYPSLAYLT